MKACRLSDRGKEYYRSGVDDFFQSSSRAILSLAFNVGQDEDPADGLGASDGRRGRSRTGSVPNVRRKGATRLASHSPEKALLFILIFPPLLLLI